MKIKIVVSGLTMNHYAELGDNSDRKKIYKSGTLPRQNMSEIIKRVCNGSLSELLKQSSIVIEENLDIIGDIDLVK